MVLDVSPVCVMNPDKLLLLLLLFLLLPQPAGPAEGPGVNEREPEAPGTRVPHTLQSECLTCTHTHVQLHTHGTNAISHAVSTDR